MTRIALILAVALATANAARAQTRQIVVGQVRSETDGSPIAGVRVVVRRTNIVASSDATGQVLVRGLPNRPLVLVFESVGMASDSIKLTPTALTFEMRLRPTTVRLAPVVAAAPPAARQRFEEVAQTSTVNLAPAEIANAPALLEADVARAVQLLPGTVSKNDFSTTLNIRGGEGDQNLIQLDGITLFNPSHMGGLFSTFDAGAVEDVELITGGFPARYGGRLSSVVDVGLRDGNPTRFAARGGLSLLSAKLLVEGPIGGSGASYMVGGRRTYADAVVNTLSPGTLPYYFADALAKVSVPTPGNGHLSLTSYWGRDALDWEWDADGSATSNVNVIFNWGNRVAGLNFDQPLGPLVLHQHVSASYFSTALGLEPDLVRFDNSARLLTANTNVAFPEFLGHTLRVGGAIEDYRMEYAIASGALEADFFRDVFQPRIWSAFLDDQWRPFRQLILRPGVRVEHLPNVNFTRAAPRASFKLFVSEDHAFIGSLGRYYQAIHSLRDQEIPYAVFEFWVGAGEFVPVAKSDHVVLGFERWIRRDLTVTVEGYRKTFTDLVTRNREQDLKRPDDDFIPTTGDAWGLDLLVRKYGGTWTGWLAYGYAQAERTTALEETFAPAHDRRHTINLVARTNGPWGSELGLRWGYGSPLPYTGFVGQWRHRVYDEVTHSVDSFSDEPIAGATRNGERYPTYSRLDVSLRWETVKWGGILKPYVQLVNAYNRRNVFFYSFDYDSPPPTRTGISQLPFVPTFGVEFQW